MSADLWRGSPVQPRAWQADALPVVLDALRQKKRGLVVATMGSGKSRLQAQLVRLALSKTMERGQRIVVVAPRKRLVRQLAATIGEHCGAPAVGMFYGGAKQDERPVVVCCAASLPALRARLRGAGVGVSLLVVDEAHNSESEVQLAEVPALEPVVQVGFTATPFRSAPKESLSLWDEVLYRYTMADALRDRVLVPLRVVRWQGDEHAALDPSCLEMMQAGHVGPNIVSARNIADAEGYADWLTGQGWPAAAIHSGHSDREQAGRLEALRTGKVRSLVHVALLAEGVDLPWLMSLTARRKVGAAVRHYQEFGRIQRAHPGKVEAVMWDPHLLMGRFGEYPAEPLARALEDAAEAEAREPAVRGEWIMTQEQALAFDLLVEHLERVRDDLERAGVVAPRKVERGGWELAPVSERQVEAIMEAKRHTRHCDSEYRPSLKLLAKIPWAMTRGQAGALLDVLYGSARWARGEADRRELDDRARWNLCWRRSGDIVAPLGHEDLRAVGGKRARAVEVDA